MLLSTTTKKLEDKERSRDFSVPRVYDGGWKTMVSEKGDIDNVRRGDRWRVGCQEPKQDSILQSQYK